MTERLQEKDKDKDEKKGSLFSQNIETRVRHKLHAMKHSKPGIWFGLGMMGLIGWSVVVPTLLGAALGIWIDKNFTSEHSWTLALLIAGLTLGCFNAWHWVAKEDKEMREDQENGNKK